MNAHAAVKKKPAACRAGWLAFALATLAVIAGNVSGQIAEVKPPLISPAGEWHTFGDGGDKPRAVIRITEAGGVYTGRIVRSLVPGEDPDKICTKCTDERRDKRLNGMAFLTGMRKVESNRRSASGSEAGTDTGGPYSSNYGIEYSSGEILDPDTGNIYRSTMTLSADGRRLTVRGYIGIPLFGRTQEWRRAD